MKRWATELLWGVLLTAFILLVTAGVQWFTTSIAITQHGPVRWSDGWDRVQERWFGTP